LTSGLEEERVWNKKQHEVSLERLKDTKSGEEPIGLLIQLI
jgi:hypothetical protein